MNLSVNGWNSLVQAQPLDPLSIISNCLLGATVGVWTRSTTFLQASWGTNTIAYSGNNTTVLSLDTTDQTTVVQAAQFVVKTKMVNVGASINPAVEKVAFVKAGPYWQNQIELLLGATNWSNVQLSFRDNLGTTGSFAGSASGAVPVFSFGAGPFTGATSLYMTIATPGTYSLALVLDNAGVWSTFEMEIVAL
jgi:hypothetical protein